MEQGKACLCDRNKLTAPKVDLPATVPKKIIATPNAPQAVGPYR